MKIDLNTSLKNNIHENSLKKTMKTEIQQLQSLVTIVMEMIIKDYPDTTSVCSKDSMNLGEFKKRVKLTY